MLDVFFISLSLKWVNNIHKLATFLFVINITVFDSFNTGGICTWWARQDSNLGPMDYESTALTN